MQACSHNKRSLLVMALKNAPKHMHEKLMNIREDASLLKRRKDMVWYLLLQSAATQGNSKGWDRLRGDSTTLKSVSYDALKLLPPQKRCAQILAALKRAKVRMQSLKAPRLARNVNLITKLGGAAAAKRAMFAQPSRETKLKFIRAFDGIGPKYGRNIWMDIEDPDFENSVAVDVRLKNIASALEFSGKSYAEIELFFCDIAREASLTPWEVDRLLYTFTDYFLNSISGSHSIGSVVPHNVKHKICCRN